jgi:hypothetical protein
VNAWRHDWFHLFSFDVPHAGGDFPTRKGFFDALLSGCVPVIFEPTAALTQWPLHWQVPITSPPGRSDREADAPAVRNVAEDCVVYIPRDTAMHNMTETFAQLLKLSRDVAFVRRKLMCIAQVGFRMQYSLPNDSAQDRRRWGPDALDVVLDHILNSKKSLNAS